MFYTDGVIIIHDGNNDKLLNDAIEKVKTYFEDEKGLEVEFEMDKSKEFPAFFVPKDITYYDLEASLRPHLALRAINSDILLSKEKKNVTVKYTYSDDDLRDISDKLSENVLELSKIESEKKRVMAEYKAKMDKIDEQIQNLAQNHSQGYEYRDYQTFVKFNFADKIKYYIDVNEEETIRKTEPMEGRDFQLSLSHTAEKLFIEEDHEQEAPEDDFEAI